MIRRSLPLVMVILLLLPASAVRAADEGWFFSVFGGVCASAGGELLRVKSSDPTNHFLTPDGRSLTGVEMRTELSASGSAGLRVGTGIGERLTVAGSLAFADLDVKATVRSSANNVDEYDYDQMFVILGDLTIAYDWIPSGSTPYVLAGLGFASMDFEARDTGEDMDQTKLGLVLGFGYRLRALEGFDIDFDVRDTIVSPDVDAEEERLAAEEFSEGGSQHLWQLSAGWTYRF